jgi:hypothetical protein
MFLDGIQKSHLDMNDKQIEAICKDVQIAINRNRKAKMA